MLGFSYFLSWGERILRLSEKTLWTLEFLDPARWLELPGRGLWVWWGAVWCHRALWVSLGPPVFWALPCGAGYPAQSSYLLRTHSGRNSIFQIIQCRLLPNSAYDSAWRIQLESSQWFSQWYVAGLSLLKSGNKDGGAVLPPRISGSSASNHGILNGMLALGIRIKKIRFFGLGYATLEAYWAS